MTEITNAQRAERVLPFIDKYTEDHNDGDSIDTAAQDMISDILHAVKLSGGWASQKLDVFLRMAWDNFEAESREPILNCDDNLKSPV